MLQDKFANKVLDNVTAMAACVYNGVKYVEKQRAIKLGVKVGQLKKSIDKDSDGELLELKDQVIVRKSGSLNALPNGTRFRHMRELFGERQPKVPKCADPKIKILEQLDSKRLIEANRIICEAYKKELLARRDGSQFVHDPDDGIPNEYFRNFAEMSMMVMRQKLGLLPQPFEGPPLKHRPGRLRWGVPTNILIEERKQEKMN